MANPGYVRSTDGSDADNGSTWALANATLAGAITDAAAGDTIYVSQAHAETQASAMTLTLKGTVAAPDKILCGNDAAEPPTALATTATVTTTGANALNVVGGSGYIYGIAFACGTGASAASLTLNSSGGAHHHYDNCLLRNNTTNSGATITVGNTAGNSNKGSALFVNCQFKFGQASQTLVVAIPTTISGGSLESGTSAITAFITPRAQNPVDCLVEGFDLTNAATSVALVVGGALSAAGVITFRNCKLPATWSGTLLSTAITTPGVRAEMWNCSASDTNYQMWVEDYAGSIKHETTIVHTGGASDGDTPISWKMASSANAEYPTIILRSPEIFVPNTTTGASKTLTVEIAQDGTTTALNDNEIWLEVEYLGTSGVPLALFADDCKADVLATAAAQANSSESWGGLSGTNKKQALSVTFTPQEEGVYIARVCLAKASTTVYVDPKVTVS